MQEDHLEHIISNSFKDFHAKGFDYICLSRTPKLTRKVYFLNGDVTKVPEVVNPHNHRYGFTTRVLLGKMADHVFMPLIGDSPDAEMFDRYDYLTPLNGGTGFTCVGEDKLVKYSTTRVDPKLQIMRGRSTIHTIQMLEDQTVLYLEQMEDVVPVGVPTQCWSRKGEPKPDATGMYSSFTADEVIDRLRIIDMLFQRNGL